jgi:hypothetical protein
MAKRYSGTVTINIKYIDASSQYRCYIDTPITIARNGCVVYVRPPAYLDHAVDSAIAYDNAARAAIALTEPCRDGKPCAARDVQECCDYDDSGVVICRSERAVGAYRMNKLDAADAARA